MATTQENLNENRQNGRDIFQTLQGNSATETPLPIAANENTKQTKLSNTTKGVNK